MFFGALFPISSFSVCLYQIYKVLAFQNLVAVQEYLNQQTTAIGYCEFIAVGNFNASFVFLRFIFFSLEFSLSREHC